VTAVEYATLADLSAEMPDDLSMPNDGARMLRNASKEIDRFLIKHGAIYDTDATTDLPTDTDVIEAFRDATVAQALWWIETGDERGFASVVASANPGGGGPTYSGGIPRIAPDALDILTTATDTGGNALFPGPWMP